MQNLEFWYAIDSVNGFCNPGHKNILHVVLLYCNYVKFKSICILIRDIESKIDIHNWLKFIGIKFNEAKNMCNAQILEIRFVRVRTLRVDENLKCQFR